MISVIVPVFNVENYIDECLKSIIAQTYEDIEILCIDDCTLDNSINIVKKYMHLDPRVRLINHPQNRGLGGARNTGIRQAKGEYIVFVDSDDILREDMLEKCYAAITSHDVDAVVCGLMQLSVANDRTPHSSFHTLQKTESRVYHIDGHKERLTNMWPSAWNKLYKTSIIREYNCVFPEKLLYEDHYFFYNYFAHVRAFYYISDPLYIYRVSRPGSITGNLSGREKEVYTVLASLKPIFQQQFPETLWKKAYAKVCFRLIWERHFLFWPNPEDWRKFCKTASQWLLAEFDLNTLQNSVDTTIDKNDAFYRYMFTTGVHRFIFRAKIALKDKKWANLLRNQYYRIKGIRSKRAYIKELSWLGWDNHKKIDELIWCAYTNKKAIEELLDSTNYENITL